MSHSFFHGVAGLRDKSVIREVTIMGNLAIWHASCSSTNFGICICGAAGHAILNQKRVSGELKAFKLDCRQHVKTSKEYTHLLLVYAIIS